PEDAADLERLFAQARAKGLRVERMVRVACPARGTLLASRRLDAYLSVLQWALELGGQVVLSTLVEFLHGIAKNRADFDQLPGIRDRRGAAAGAAALLLAHRPALLGGRGRERHPRPRPRTRRQHPARGAAAGGLRAAGDPGLEHRAGRAAHVAWLELRQWPAE